MKKKITIYLLIIVGFVGMILFGVYTVKNENSKVNSNPIVDGTSTSDDVIDMPKNIVFKRNAAESEEDSSITVRCTIIPSDALNKRVLWSVVWVTEKSEDVNDYVSLLVSEDTLSCKVTVNKGFSTQINLFAASAENSSIKKSCVLDYYKRYYADETKFNRIIYGESYDSATNHVEIGQTYAYEYENDTLNDLIVCEPDVVDFKMVGTTGSSYVYTTVQYQFSQEFIDSYKKYKPDTTLLANKRYESGGDKVAETFEEFFYNISSEYSSDVLSFLKAMKGIKNVFTVYVDYVVKSKDGVVFNTYNFSCTVGDADVDSLFKVTDIAIENESYVFL